MILVFAIVAVVMALPLLLILAVVLGPVILGIMCAAGCALIVFSLGNLVLGLGWLGRSIERAGLRHAHRS